MKRDQRSRARDLYLSPLFKKSLAYAEHLGPDAIVILSAKYGVLGLDDQVDPYDETLNRMSASEVRAWSDTALGQLRDRFDLSADCFTVLAGQRYRQHLLPHLIHHDVPMAGLRIGEQLGFLTRAHKTADDGCARLHRAIWALPRHHHPVDPDLVPRNGIYIVFEEGEEGHGGPRIVRIGTHTGDNQLRSRLRQHFVQENKDRSIFRKNIGRAMLARSQDDYLEVWDLDLTTRAAKDQHGHRVNTELQAEIETRVSEYIQGKFSVALIEVATKDDRLRLEARLISTVSRCQTCSPSDGWLGRCSPKAKIRESGLWQVNELYKAPFSEHELTALVRQLQRAIGSRG